MCDILNCFFSSIVYPFYINNGLPEFPTPNFFALWFSEGFFFIDIILNFFKQGVDEQGNTLYDPLRTVALNYYRGELLVDLIAFLPWGYMLVGFDPKLKVFWLIKAIRIAQLNKYIKDRALLPVINKWLENKEKKYLEDEHMYWDII